MSFMHRDEQIDLRRTQVAFHWYDFRRSLGQEISVILVGQLYQGVRMVCELFALRSQRKLMAPALQGRCQVSYFSR